MTATTGKRKEIYKYLAPWPLYSMNWSVRPDKRFRLALGSFIEEYNNKVQIISLDEETSEFSAKRYTINLFPPTPIRTQIQLICNFIVNLISIAPKTSPFIHKVSHPQPG